MDNVRIKPVSKLVKNGAIGALLFLSLQAISQDNFRAMNKSLDVFLSDPAMETASVGLSIIDLATGKPVFSHDAARRLTPASSQKIIVGATALEVLGPDHQFVTPVYAAGQINSGVLEGNLVIVAQGDPTLGSVEFGSAEAFLNAVVAAVKNAGISAVTGQIIVDNSFFNGFPLAGSTSISDAGNYYAAGSSAVHYRDNRFSLYFNSPATSGELATLVKTNPEVPYLTIVNEVEAANTQEDNAYIFSIPGSDHLIVRGNIPRSQRQFEIKGALHEPGKLLVLELEAALKTAGISVENKVLSPTEGSTLIYTTTSPPLKEIIAYMLRTSDNSYADCMVQQLGKNLNENGSFEGGEDAIQTYWGSRGMPNAEWRQDDGSGLSRANAIAAGQISYIIAASSKETREALKLGLKPMRGNTSILVKSGYISDVRAYAGFIDGMSGKYYAFSIIVNNHNQSASAMRRQIESLINEFQELL
jgi:serine-type D-Ala-D-Ala carboxypeptidase/endopeptidase (penicillin-binding protein 4)